MWLVLVPDGTGYGADAFGPFATEEAAQEWGEKQDDFTLHPLLDPITGEEQT